jgi:hypothetical protein
MRDLSTYPIFLTWNRGKAGAMCFITLSPASGYLHSYAYVPTQALFLHTQLKPHGSPGSIAVSCVFHSFGSMLCGY